MSVYYIEDINGNFVSEDNKKRYKRLSGSEAYEFLKSENGKSKIFMKINGDGCLAETTFFEISKSKEKDYEKYKRRIRYSNDIRTKSGYTFVSLNSNGSEETADNHMTGEEMIPDENADVFEEANHNIELQMLHRALKSLSKEEYDLIYMLFFVEQPMTLAEYADKIGVHLTTVKYRRDRIFEKLRKIL